MSIWDTPIKDDNKNTNSFPVAKPGEYEFEVEKIKGREYTPKPSSRIGKCAQIDLQLRVETPEGDVRVFDRLYSDPLTLWKMTAFAKSIGIFTDMMTPGDILQKAEGEIGKAYIKLIPANGQYPEKNEVGRYIEKPAADPEELPF